MSNKRFGIKEVADVTFYEIDTEGRPIKPVICLDTLKVSNIEQTAEQVDSKGGKGNASLLIWDHSKEINVVLQDAILSDKTFEMAFGEKKDGEIVISAGTFPKTYYIEGTTFARSLKTGVDEIFKFVIPKAKIVSENTLTMEAEGDPTVFDIKLRVLRDKSGKMMKMIMETDPDQFDFINLRNGTVSIAAKVGPVYQDIIFPSSYQNKKISMINNNAFEEEETLTSVVIPDGIEYISDYAFAYCPNLTKVDFDNTKNCEIGYATFSDCPNLSMISFNDSDSCMWTINEEAFANCISLAYVSLPKNVSLVEGAFQACTSLQEIGVHKKSNFKVVDGALIEGVMLIQYPCGKEGPCVIPDLSQELSSRQLAIAHTSFKGASKLTKFTCDNEVSYIRPSAFEDCAHLEEVSFSKKALLIEKWAFRRCSSLTKIFLGEARSIANTAFRDCNNLTEIHIDMERDDPNFPTGAPWGAVNATIYAKGEQIYPTEA